MGNQLSIRSRVLLLALVPMLTLAGILGSYFTYSRLSDSTDKMLERGHLITDLLASAAEFGVISGNRYQLRILSQKTRQTHPEVRDILFYDADFNLLHRSQTFPVELSPASPSHQALDKSWLFFSPITTSALLLENNPELAMAAPQPGNSGWVAMVLSADGHAGARREMLMNSLLLIGAGLLVTAVVAGRFGLRITRPIQALSQVVERLEEGQLDTRAATTQASGELGRLARGINRMASRIQASSREQSEQISKATRQLTTTLRHLEQQNEALSLARRQADEANHAKDEFLARMSHELRTPLTSVLGFSKLMQRTQLTQEQQQYCQIIDQTSTLLLTIIDDILDFSRLQSDAIELEQLPFSPRQCLLNLLEMQAPMAQHKGLTLIEELSTELPEALVGDPTRLSQVLTNLLSNAIKFTQDGEVRLSAQAIRAGRHCKLTLSVSDTGIGISPEHQRHLFQAFSQADNTISRRYGGSGLGLVIAHRLTQMMGGNLELESQEGIGTRVALTLTLPLATGSLSETPQNTAQEYTSNYQLSCPLKVLLAEDNDFNRLLIYKVLNQAGARVITAVSGTLAVERFRQERPDLVLMDVHMPQMDGIEATRQIRRLDKQTPIIALTANVMPHEHQALQQAGADAVMMKPVKLPELFAHLDRLCRVSATGSDQTPAELLEHVDPEELHRELEQQLDALCPAVEEGQLEVIRRHAHQLLGLAGLYQLPELEAAVADLHQAAVAGDIPLCWKRCFRLRRLIEHHQYH
ncbi:hybrid sensor histidine kinase/response regulator [Marinobacterium sediminicola]|uniref:hybrid sensor histidine kinase/response regulator n=1 Tax=Marinobacterium sediminicola TaxID=518898 RepID=UPI001EF06A57|nr:hybrid sensor histidine kinase/response regulator [Marinobacterium sediminicola]ULG68869.1 ATP-binding protein [Marinobacterium sediminicola]